jgi:hypothetical protein
MNLQEQIAKLEAIQDDDPQRLKLIKDAKRAIDSGIVDEQSAALNNILEWNGKREEAAQSAPTPEPVTPTPEPVAPEPVAPEPVSEAPIEQKVQELEKELTETILNAPNCPLPAVLDEILKKYMSSAQPLTAEEPSQTTSESEVAEEPQVGGEPPAPEEPQGTAVADESQAGSGSSEEEEEEESISSYSQGQITPELEKQYNEAKALIDGKGLYREGYSTPAFLCALVTDTTTDRFGYMTSKVSGVGVLFHGKMAYVVDEAFPFSSGNPMFRIYGKITKKLYSTTNPDAITEKSVDNDVRFYAASKVHVASFEEITSYKSNMKNDGVINIENRNISFWKAYKEHMQVVIMVSKVYSRLNSIDSDVRLKRNIKDDGINEILFERFNR